MRCRCFGSFAGSVGASASMRACSIQLLVAGVVAACFCCKAFVSPPPSLRSRVRVLHDGFSPIPPTRRKGCRRHRSSSSREGPVLLARNTRSPEAADTAGAVGATGVGASDDADSVASAPAAASSATAAGAGVSPGAATAGAGSAPAGAAAGTAAAGTAAVATADDAAPTTALSRARDMLVQPAFRALLAPMAVAGALLGPNLDNFHSAFGVLTYKNPIELSVGGHVLVTTDWW